MTPNATPRSDSLPTTIAMPPLDDDAVIQIHDFIHQLLDLFEIRYGEQIRRFYEGLGGADLLQDIDNRDEPPF